MVLPTATPLYADLIDTTIVTVTDSTNTTPYTLNLNLSSVNISDTANNNMALSLNSIQFTNSTGTSTLDATSLNVSSSGNSLAFSVDSSSITTIQTHNTLNVNSDTLNISSAVSLNLPTGSGSATQVLAGDGNGYVKWLDFSALALSSILNIEAGTYINNGNISTTISFQNPYPYNTLNGLPLPPVVILTPDADGSGNIIPVSINGYNDDGDNFNSFNVIFGSSKLQKLNFVVLPTGGAVQDGSVNISTLPVLESNA